MKNIAIVGASRGIGLEFVRQLSTQNKVFAFCRKTNSELDELEAAAQVTVIQDCDVNSESSLKEAAQKLGEHKLDLFLHVAGILSSETFDDLNRERLLQQFISNSLGPLFSVKAFRPYLNKGAKIGLLTSRMGSIADNDSGAQYGYRMSKAALNAAGKSLAIDLKPDGIAVFLLHPGYVRTDMTSHRGNIDPDESVRGLLRVIESKGLDDTGSFWHANGEALPW